MRRCRSGGEVCGICPFLFIPAWGPAWNPALGEIPSGNWQTKDLGRCFFPISPGGGAGRLGPLRVPINPKAATQTGSSDAGFVSVRKKYTAAHESIGFLARRKLHGNTRSYGKSRK